MLNGLTNTFVVYPYTCKTFIKLVQICGFHSKLSEKGTWAVLDNLLPKLYKFL